ncbi:MAG: glucose 1-dehydrogenase [Acidimicrobiales bacterium]|nr:glucose 1-dehydrogenase [Acidimicrobiales bacterium]
MLERFLVTDRVAIVTGAGKGIGAAIAATLAEAGADVALVARTRSDLDAVAMQVEAHGRRALVLPADLRDPAVLPELVEATVAVLGGLDIVVNNAGGSRSHAFLDTTVEHLEASFRFNVSVPFELSRLAVPHLLARGGGAIVNIGSVAGSRTTRGGLVHGTTKAALAHMTRMMSADLAPRIRVNAVLPGAVETDALKQYLDHLGGELRATMVERTPMRRNGEPDDIAAAVLYLVSPAASWVTGKLLEVDGDASGDLIPKTLPDL